VIDLQHFPNSGGEMKIIATIRSAPMTERVLLRRCLQAWAPPRPVAPREALPAA